MSNILYSFQISGSLSVFFFQHVAGILCFSLSLPSTRKRLNPSAQVDPCDGPQVQLLDLDYANRVSGQNAREGM